MNLKHQLVIVKHTDHRVRNTQKKKNSERVLAPSVAKLLFTCPKSRMFRRPVIQLCIMNFTRNTGSSCGRGTRDRHTIYTGVAGTYTLRVKTRDAERVKEAGKSRNGYNNI